MNMTLSKQSNVQAQRVVTEGDELYYEVRGQGQPLLLIAGGGGDARWYSLIADILADEYKVISYDRRANARSSGNEPQNFEISQQSRDAVAVLRAAGEDSAIVFGNSSGAVIALDMAKTQPQAIKAVIVHEPPVARIHPDARKWQRFFAGVYSTSWRLGSAFASLRFALGVGLPLRQFAQAARNFESPAANNQERRQMREHTSDVLIQLELLPITTYLPDIEAIKRNGVKVIMAAGARSLEKQRFYAQTAPILAQKLGCMLETLPGHHIAFVDRPNEWAAAFRSILHRVTSVS
ncbi:MAG: alpha/beta hydrolase [Anaerolineae bacterium]|nr:alpha/beta hydrolase [Anaerolineae bacterium]